MKKINIALMVAVLLISAGAAFAQEFSAEMISTGEEGSFKGKIFVGNDKTRVEAPGTITITRMDQKVVWVIMPNEKAYIEQPFSPKSMVASRENFPGELERTFLEKELVGGKTALKYEVTYQVGGMTEHIFQWVDEATKIPVKTAGMDGTWTVEYRNIQRAFQDDKLFELPSGYSRIPYTPPSEHPTPMEPEDETPDTAPSY